MILQQLLLSARQRPSQPLIMQQLLEQLEAYKQWDVWKTHPLCFLAPEEITLLEMLLSCGSAESVAEAVGFTVARVRHTMPLLQRKIHIGYIDYLRTMAIIFKPGGTSVADCQKVLLLRPIPLLSNSFLPSYDTGLWELPNAEHAPNTLADLQNERGVVQLLRAHGLSSLPQDFHKLLVRYHLDQRFATTGAAAQPTWRQTA